MGNIRTGFSNSVRFTLSVSGYKPLEIVEPKGWAEDGIELARHDKYLGIFTSFTNDLVFFGDSEDYIRNAYLTLGVNARLNIIKEELEDVDGLVKFTTKYRALADFKTMQEDENGLKIKFNSNNLAEILKSHGNDKFQTERLTSIDNIALGKLKLDNVEIKGRDLLLRSESIIRDSEPIEKRFDFRRWYYLNVDKGVYNVNGIFSKPDDYASYINLTPLSTIISEGVPRHSAVDEALYAQVDNVFELKRNSLTASNAFYTNSVDLNEIDRNLSIEYNFDSNISITTFSNKGGRDIKFNVKYEIIKYELNKSQNEESFNLVNTSVLTEKEFYLYNVSTDQTKIFNLSANGFLKEKVKKDELLVACISVLAENMSDKDEYGKPIKFLNRTVFNSSVKKWDIKINETALVEPSPSLNFSFYHDTWRRILQIMTGRENAFYSKFFGRKELGYKEDGEGSLIGLMSGFCARDFNPDSDKYKSLTTSHNDLLESADAIFNIGLGIEVVGFEERVRVEPVEYFFRERTVIILDKQVKESRKIIPNEFFSGLEFGYRRGGDYEDDQGLDEPNTRSNRVTPIRTSSKKYTKLARFRSDEYGLERLRRKPQINYPTEDTRGDSDNWLLDLKRGDIPGVFEQKIWSDRLQELPVGVFSPETYKSAYFTPLRMMFRHAKSFMSGIEPYRDRLITYTTGVANVVLQTKFIGETKAYKENQDIPIDDLDQALTLPEEIKFKYPLDSRIIDLINGKTQELVNGEVEMVPNYYYKVQFINRKGNTEKGYIKNVKIQDDLEITLIKSNENIL